ncbi:TolC family outer membrane protein [Chromobacterium piscinae]|uniref:TolC family outer membrane protein n=1 Tax=Chromobacterium piscinae TaxID=686831 RepID=A0ABV0HBK1_9NEIS
MKTPYRTLLNLIAVYLLTQQASAFTLDQAWQAALQYNSDQAAAQAERDAGLQQRAKGLAPLLPQVSLNGSYQHLMPESPEPTTNVISRQYQLTLRQTLFDLARFAGYQKGQYSADLANIRFEINQQQRYVDVAQTYYNVLQAQDTLAATQASQKAYVNQLQQARLALETGLGTQIEVYEAEASVNGAEAKAIVDQNLLEIHRQTLHQLTGLNPLEIQPITIDARAPDTTLQEWQDQAASHNLNIKAAELMLHIAESDLTASRSGHLPTVTFEASNGESHSNERNWLSGPAQPKRENRVGVQIHIPIFNGGGVRAQVLESASLKEAARYKLESSKRQTREDVRKAYLNVASGAQQIRAQEQLVKSAKSKLESTQLGKEVGIRTQLEVLQAEREGYEALTSLAAAKYGYLNAWVQLRIHSGNSLLILPALMQ